jgi:hypothetical protein
MSDEQRMALLALPDDETTLVQHWTLSGELIPDTPLAFVAEQLQVAPEVLADYATRGPTRYEQLDALREGFGFTPFSRPLRVALQEWLLPIALTTTSGAGLARSLLGECRRRRIIVPGISSVERMVAQALLDAERHVAEHLTRGLETGQRRLLDALLLPHAGTNLSGLGWVRQPPGKPGRNTFAVIIRRLALLRDIGIDPISPQAYIPNACDASVRKGLG